MSLLDAVSSAASDDHVLSVAERIDIARQMSAGMRVDQPDGIRRPPGPSQRRALAAALTGKVSSLGFIGSLYDHDPIGYAHVGPEHVYALADPELIWKAFATHDGDTRRSRAIQATRPILGNGILTAEEPEHRRNRSLVQPAFSPRRITTYGGQMVDATNRLSGLWASRELAGETDVILADEMANLTLDIVGRTLFGADLTSSTSEISQSLTTVLGQFSQLMSPIGLLMMRAPTRRRHRMITAVERLDAVVARLIADKRAALARGEASDDMLAVLIGARDAESGEGLSMNELRDEAMTLVLAGHETTANALAWSWLLLSMNPVAKRWVQDEWDSVATGRDLVMADISSLPRTRATVAESMRLRPPAWIVGRRLTADIELAGYRVPRGSTTLASQYFMHRHPRYWRNPNSFDPTRWIGHDGAYDEKAPGQPRAAWFPFGFASRKCIGDRFALAEAVLAMATLGRQWEVVVKDPRSVIPTPAITLRPSNGIPARIRRR